MCLTKKRSSLLNVSSRHIMATCTTAVTYFVAILLIILSFDPASSVNARETWWRSGSGRTQRLRQRSGSSQQTLDPQAVTTAIQVANTSVSQLANLERILGSANVRVHPGSAAHGAFIASKPHTSDALLKHSQAQIALRASQYIADKNCRKFNLKDKMCGVRVNSLSLAGTSLASSCVTNPPISCKVQNSKYRSFDGSCNNLQHPMWGAALTAYRRLLPPSYADGLGSPRDGKFLPNPRDASIALVKSDPPGPGQSQVTLATAIWSQFVSMDLAHTPSVMMLGTNSSIACCKPDGSPLLPRSRHPACLPITISANTAGRNGRRCMDFVRSLTAPRPDCRFGFAEQMNQATHWLDGNPLYGTNNEVSSQLREMAGGRLLLDKQKRMLPLSNEPSMACQDTKKSSGPCFRAGDARVNEHPLLTSLVTILAREHNRIAEKLSEINPQWQDETLFHEARRIVIAEIQHITYQQWLPLLIGKSLAHDVSNADYSANTNPSVLNSLSALPFTLSMLPTSFQLHSESRSILNATLRLRQHFNRPAVVAESGRLDDLVRSLATQQAHPVDLQHTDDVTRNLYAAEGVGLDAISLAIQRGRDHGLPDYNAFRKACGLPKANTIQEFADVIDAESISRLSRVYRNANDVDLYLGAIAEHSKDNKSLLGPTLSCLLSKQLVDTRRADRFFYDIDKGFSPAQLLELQKSNLARIFCDNGDNIKNMQPDVFHPPGSAENTIMPCDQIFGPNFTAWRTTR